MISREEMNSMLRFAGRTRDELAEAIEIETRSVCSDKYINLALSTGGATDSHRRILTAAGLICRRWVEEKSRKLEAELSEKLRVEVEIVPPIEGRLPVIVNGEYIGLYSMKEGRMVK